MVEGRSKQAHHKRGCSKTRATGVVARVAGDCRAVDLVDAHGRRPSACRSSSRAINDLIGQVSAPEVVEVATGLNEITTDDLRARYDLRAIRRAELSPLYERWKPAHFDEFLLPAFADLSAFYAKAAKRGSSVVLVIY